MLKQALLEGLRARHAAPGETVEFSWFVFRVVGDVGGFDIETLDFQQMASFTRDFGVVEQIHAQQLQALEQAGVEAERCTVRHFGYVHLNYAPGHPHAFMCRVRVADRSESGWYVGLQEDGLHVNDLRGHRAMSLYEMSLHDRRLLPFWLLPQGYSVVFQGRAPTVVPPAEQDRYFATHLEASRPWWKFW